jgi:leucyl aminopeptidase
MLKFFRGDSQHKRKEADALVLPYLQKKSIPHSAVNFPFKEAQPALKLKDFKGKEGELLPLYPQHASREKRIIALGLGAEGKITLETLRRAAGSLVRYANRMGIQTINLMVPELQGLTEGDVVRGLSEGLLSQNYLFDRHKSKKDPQQLLKSVYLYRISKRSFASAQKSVKIYEGVYFTRDIVNENADTVTPQQLGIFAKQIAKKYSGKIRAKVLGKKEIEKEKMGLLLAVNKGSARDPALIVLSYRGNPKAKSHTVVIGKGITYDTGGLHIKPIGGMETMRADMAGGAACLGLIIAAANLKLKQNITIVIPSTENCTDSKSFKPGDVFTGASGKTVEILNTDAEGRLVLADAFTYAQKYLKPTRLIDMATLTGAIDIALGPESTGMMSNDDKLAEGIIRAGTVTFERVARLPLLQEYLEKLKSDIADLRNIGGGRSGGSIKSALFLEQFVEGLPWAHLDIASTAFLSEPQRYQPKNATGVGVRLLIEFLENHP